MNTRGIYSKVEDFLKDDAFIKYVLDDAPDAVFNENSFLQEHAGLLTVFQEAKTVLLSMAEDEPELEIVEREKLKHRIITSLEIKNVSY